MIHIKMITRVQRDNCGTRVFLICLRVDGIFWKNCGQGIAIVIIDYRKRGIFSPLNNQVAQKRLLLFVILPYWMQSIIASCTEFGYITETSVSANRFFRQVNDFLRTFT